MALPRIRTISEAYSEIKQADNKTSLTPHALRRLVLSGAVPSFRAGNKYLVDLDKLESYLSCPIAAIADKPINGIRRISERAN